MLFGEVDWKKFIAHRTVGFYSIYSLILTSSEYYIIILCLIEAIKNQQIIIEIVAAISFSNPTVR